MKAENENLKKEVADLTAENGKLKADVSRRTSERSTLHSQLAELNLQISTLQTLNQTLQNEIDTLKAQLKGKKKDWQEGGGIDAQINDGSCPGGQYLLLDLRHERKIVDFAVSVLIGDLACAPERGKIHTEVPKQVAPEEIQDDLGGIEHKQYCNGKVDPFMMGVALQWKPGLTPSQ